MATKSPLPSFTLPCMVIAVLLPLLGCSKSDSAGTASLRGTVEVFDSAGTAAAKLRSAVQGVVVHLEGPASRSTTTDDAGGFAFNAVPGGGYVLRFESAGQIATYRTSSGHEARIRLVDDQTVEISAIRIGSGHVDVGSIRVVNPNEFTLPEIEQQSVSNEKTDSKSDSSKQSSSGGTAGGSVTSEIIERGKGAMYSAYTGTLDRKPVTRDSLVISAGGYIFSDNGDGTLTGTAGTTGTINYTTGRWSLDFDGGIVAKGENIVASYKYGASSGDETYPTDVSSEIIGYGIHYATSYDGHLDSSQVVKGSLMISAGGYVFVDQRDGTLNGTAGTTGTINYTSGVWSIDLAGGIVPEGVAIIASYSYTK